MGRESFTHTNIKGLEDLGGNFDGNPDLEFRAATRALALERSALSYQWVPPGYRFPYGHTHATQEEVYVVVSGGGRMKIDDEIVSLRRWDAVRVPPGACVATRPGRRASRCWSSAPRISARIRAATSRGSAIGGAKRRRGPDPRQGEPGRALGASPSRVSSPRPASAAAPRRVLRAEGASMLSPTMGVQSRRF